MPKKRSERMPREMIPCNSLLIGSEDDIDYLTQSLQRFTIKTELCLAIDSVEREVYYTQQHFEQSAIEFGKTHKLPICLLVDSVLETIQKIGDDLRIILYTGGKKNAPGTILTLSATL